MAHYSQVYDFHEESNPNARSPVDYRLTYSQCLPDHIISHAGKQTPAAAATELEMYAVNPQLRLQDAPTNPQSRTPQRQPWQRRVGYFGFWILGLGTAVLLASCSFLVYLWNGASLARKGLPRPEAWDSIVFGGYAAEVTTLCSAAIRVSVGFQIGLLAAAMAAIILERSRTRLSDLASLSLSKALLDSASPWEIFLIASRRLPNRKNAVLLYWFLPLLAFLIGIAMTVTSTILLIDFKMVQIAAPRINQSIALGFDLKKDMADPSGTSYWQSRPQAQWRFAEARPSNTSNDTTLKHVSDTGDIYRASLPFENVDNRTSLEHYHGPALVTNIRTACVAPDFTNATLEYVYTGSRITEGLYLHSEIETSASWDSGPKINGSRLARISCRLNNYWNENSTSWPLSLCSFMKSTTNESMTIPLSSRPYEFQPVLLLNSSSILNLHPVIPEFTGSTEDWATVSAQGALRLAKFVKDGPWTSAITTNGTEVLKASVCFAPLNTPLLYNVTMSGSAISSEPKSQAKFKNLDPNSSEERELLGQLGIGTSGLDLRTRGILGLKIHSGPQNVATVNFDHVDLASYDWIRKSLFDYGISGGWTFNNDALMGYIESSLFWPAHPDHCYLVQTILKRTANPAVAVQALFARFYEMLYHDMQPYWTRQQYVVTTSAKQVLIPYQWTGLIAVLALIILHYTLMLVVIVLFLRSTKVSMLGNTWQAVSQIVSPETDSIIQAATNRGMTDKEIELWATTTTSNVYYSSQRSLITEN